MYLKRPKRRIRGMMLCIALTALFVLTGVSCDDSHSDLAVSFPESYRNGTCTFSLTGPTAPQDKITGERQFYLLPLGKYHWEVTDSTWTTGPRASGTIVLTDSHHELIVTEPELSNVILEIESDRSYSAEIVTETSERGIKEKRSVTVEAGKKTAVLYRDIPSGLLTVVMTDETGSPMPMLSFDVEKGRENVFSLFYKAVESPVQKEDVKLMISSPVSMDTEVLWRVKGMTGYTPVPVRVLSGSITNLTLEKIPVGTVEFAVRNLDGSMGRIKKFEVIPGSRNAFSLEAGLAEYDEKETKVTVRLMSDEFIEMTLCWMSEGMTAPLKKNILMGGEEKIYLIDWNKEGLLSLWLETGSGKVESRTEMYVSRGHQNTVSLIHSAPVPEVKPKPDDEIPKPVPPKPVPQPKPQPKWGKLNLHIKANSLEACILYFLYPGDTEWRTHQTKFNGVGIGRDYEFNNIPPGTFRYTFSLVGGKPFPVNTVNIEVGENSAYYVYYIEEPKLPDLPDPVPTPEPEPDPVPPSPQPEPETPKKVIKGEINMEELGYGDFMLLRFVNQSGTPNVTCTWYVDGKQRASGDTLRIKKGTGTSCELWASSPEADEELVISVMLPGGQYVPFRTRRK